MADQTQISYFGSMSRGVFVLLACLLPAAAMAAPLPNTDVLLKALQNAGSEPAARAIEQQIDKAWSQSGSPSADLLLERARAAAEDEDYDTALRILAKLTEVAPNFAEAWHQRAEIAAVRQDFHVAMASLRKTLTLQPRHFVALASLGAILEEFGNKGQALAAYRKALALNPYLEGLPDRIRALSRDVEGQGI
jgi:tetratricopeptide (TPR) repeat protein